MKEGIIFIVLMFFATLIAGYGVYLILVGLWQLALLLCVIALLVIVLAVMLTL